MPPGDESLGQTDRSHRCYNLQGADVFIAEGTNDPPKDSLYELDLQIESDLYPSFGLLLRPEWSAVAMSESTVTVTLNALLINRVTLRASTKPS
jgi:hypothetical protein